MKTNDNKKIKCDVESCKYNDGEDYCELESIEVTCTCDNCDCKDSKETVCNSFECDEEKCKSCDDEETSNITDNEYEVQSESDEDENDYEYEQEEDND